MSLVSVASEIKMRIECIPFTKVHQKFAHEGTEEDMK